MTETACVVCLQELSDQDAHEFAMCYHSVHRECSEGMRIAAEKTGARWRCPSCRSPSRAWVAQNVPRLTKEDVESFAAADVPLVVDGEIVYLYHIESNPYLKETWDRCSNLEHRNHLGETAILFALRKRVDASSIVERADLSARNDAGDSASHLMGADPEMAKHGDPLSIGSMGRTPLYYAAISGTVSGAEAAKIWIERGADAAHRDSRRDTPLLSALRKRVSPPECLVSTHRERDCDGNSALHVAEAMGMRRFVERLLREPGVDAQARNYDGKPWKRTKTV